MVLNLLSYEVFFILIDAYTFHVIIYRAVHASEQN